MVLYNIKNNKNDKMGRVWGRVGGARFDSKPSQVGEKDKKVVLRYPAHNISFKKFQRAITPKWEITRKRKKYGSAIFYEESIYEISRLALTV